MRFCQSGNFVITFKVFTCNRRLAQRTGAPIGGHIELFPSKRVAKSITRKERMVRFSRRVSKSASNDIMKVPIFRTRQLTSCSRPSDQLTTSLPRQNGFRDSKALPYYRRRPGHWARTQPPPFVHGESSLSSRQQHRGADLHSSPISTKTWSWQGI